MTDENGKVKKEDVTVTRSSPLKNSAIVSVTSIDTVEHWSVMARQDGDPVPYTKEEYSAIMKGMFALDLAQIGTFASYNKTGFKNLSEKLRKDILASAGAEEVDDPFATDRTGTPQKLVRLPKSERVQRARDTVSALKFISGGAMQTNNLADVVPKLVILATMTTGNHPFSHVAVSEGGRAQVFSLNVPGLREVISDYKEQLVGPVFVGVRSGFLDSETTDALTTLAEEGLIKLGSVVAMIDEYANQLDAQME